MKIHWTMAALVSSALIVGCGDRSADNSNNLQENGSAATAGTALLDDQEAVPETSARVDDSATPEAAPTRNRTQPRSVNRPSAASSAARPSPAAPTEPYEPRGTNVVAGTVDRP